MHLSARFFIQLVFGVAATGAAFAAQAFDAAAWREDFAQARSELARAYANLDWVVSDRKVDLKALVARTEAELGRATSDKEAAQALKQFLDAFGDGHVRMLPPARAAAVVAQADSAPATASCRDLGFRARPDKPLDFAAAEQFEPLANDDAALLPAGVLKAGGRKLGVIRIGLFSEHNFPALCERELAKAAGCDRACQQRLFTRAGKELTRVLARQVTALKARNIDALVIDITGNGGGTNWAEAAARVVTGPGLLAPRVAFIKHPHWVRGLTARIDDIDRDLKRESLPAAQKAWLTAARMRLAAARERASEPCDRSAIWDNRPVCPLAVAGTLHTVGLDAEPAPLDFDGYEAEWVHNNLATYEAVSAWNGPLAVLVDGNTASAAELFAATLKDSGRATLIGSRTYGSGCGYTDGGIPITLKRSGVQLKVPDCVRLRADGSNEVAGIAPDVAIGWQRGDAAAARARLATAALAGWVASTPRR